MKNKIRQELESLADEKYRIFTSKLIPNVDNVLGIRLPMLRKMARNMDRTDCVDFLLNNNTVYFEEVMLQGMLIGSLESTWKEREKYIVYFVPKINNWSVCDSFCSGLKFKADEKSDVWAFLSPYLKSNKAYDIRFAVVMLLSYFAEERYAKLAFSAFDQIKNDDYYVRMAVAWAVSIYFRALPQTTMRYLRNNRLDNWTYNKALQKIMESLTIDDATKELIRSMKRKTTRG